MNRRRPTAAPLWVAAAIDQFPAQALAAARPDLRGVAFAVVEQCADSYKAASLALSPAARRLGAEPGTPIFALRRRHGHRLRVVARDEAAEQACQNRIADLCQGWTPEHHAAGGRTRFEVFLDLAGTPAARSWGHDGVGAQAQAQLLATGLEQVAVGVAASRLVAQVLARDGLPEGVAVCPPGAELAHLAGVATDSLPGLGEACRQRAHLYGLERVEQLRRCDRATLVRRFGPQAGERLYGLVHGVAAEARRPGPATVEAETVLADDLHEDRLLRDALRLTADKACHALRQAGQVTGAVRLRLTYTDRRSVQRTARLAVSTDAFAALDAAVQALFDQLHVRRVAIKAIAVAASRTSPATGQRDLFEGHAEHRQRRLGAALTDIRRRLGFDAVLSAGALELDGRH